MNNYNDYRILLAMICLTLALAMTIGNVTASPTQQTATDFAAIDTYITEQINNLDIPGLALGIVQDGHIAHLQGFGEADSSGRAVTPQTPFYLGSVTKSFTALAVMQLVEAGKIELDATVQTYLPWFELADKEASAKITVRQLLIHTSGISTKDGMRDRASQQRLEEALRELNSIQLTQPVGSTFQYSNLNYNIAGLIVEQVSGQPYADYVTQHIFELLDMRHSFASHAPALADGLAEGHIYMFRHLFNYQATVAPSQLPSGYLSASVEDLAHYSIAQLNDGRYGDTSILSPQGIAELHAPAISTGGDRHYALGWFLGTRDENPYIQHGGTLPDYLNIIFLLPEKKMGFVLLTNASGFEQREQVNALAINITNLLTGKQADPVSLPFLNRFLYWITLLTPLGQIFGIVLVWRNSGRGTWIVFLTVILNLAVVFFIFKLSLTDLTLPTMLIFHPGLGYGLIAIATLGIGWSVIFTLMNLRARKSRSSTM